MAGPAGTKTKAECESEVKEYRALDPNKVLLDPLVADTGSSTTVSRILRPARTEDEVSDTGARLLHPCIRINRILRAMLTERALERGGVVPMRLIGLAVVLAMSVALTAPAVRAQSLTRVPRIGVLNPQKSTESPALQREPFERGLREQGWVPGTDLIVEYRYAEGKPEDLRQRAAELVGLKVDVIVARGPQAIRAAHQATTTIPILMSAGADPIRGGFVTSLARPGAGPGDRALPVGEVTEAFAGE
jgi:hypothetical protein